MLQDKTIIISGGFGFIMQELTEKLLSQGNRVLVIDKFTYASATEHTIWLINKLKKKYQQNFEIWKEDINNVIRIPDADYFIHGAAESHNDNAIADQNPFIKTNILGTEHLLQLLRSKSSFNRPRFIFISSDEVLGDNPPDGGFKEDAPHLPSSPYSASKACGENLVTGYARTFGIEYKIIRPTNTYGLFQFPEKLIPANLRHLERNEKMILYGNGNYSRVWLWKNDLCEAMEYIIEKGELNNIYHVSGDVIKTNKEVLECLYNAYWNEKIIKNENISNFEDFIEMVPNRLGEDKMYLLNDQKIRALGWKPKYTNFEENIQKIVKEYTVTNW